MEVLTYKWTQGWRQHVLELELYLLLLEVCFERGILTLLHCYKVKKFYRWKALSQYLWFNYCITMVAQCCSVLIQVLFYKLIDGLLWNDCVFLQRKLLFQCSSSIRLLSLIQLLKLRIFFSIFLTIRTTFILRLNRD